MGMTAAYLLARCEPVSFNEIKFGQPYRVVGSTHNGGIFTPEKIERGLIYFRGYIKPYDIKKVLLFLVD